MLLSVVAIALLAYLLGSFPAGYLAGRWLKGIDIRKEGSGSTGATNVLRVLGKGPALVVFITDILKGVLAVVAARAIASTNGLDPSAIAWLAAFAAIIAVVGHSLPVWLSFRGGKSVATSLGVLLALSPVVGLSGFGAFLLLLALFRIVSLGSIAGAITVIVLMLILPEPLPNKILGIASGIYVIYRHRSNLDRLRRGEEPRIGQRLSTNR
ncbi:glycerol-3-phosphate 1-O-acyltransferase PlsY [Synechococcus elongatus]|uniref:Glycerol-3-phosphate acyltransferase n=2 Tax=Synechococcus elongatus TaxID=32046 RepID=PLSY_SYNE7|nr:glycerol-3-phosphate 1-O-acyltransferase PlsY [Synechococcus elongatus]Q31LI2.1 RecName: Full=Glycerol-3-phosphate acyltransferase; AltName: Full=Acyl-PO4 G3P acyltransferase; AltName: Full=Acyl-phosphate--glycerol-3-phosphate acyltransferase; AltName: Full=G3P acyltransferase; Short=GPAT; AltName: Full=Lysophosphatidic acid synthase; Short=LPA synthase [Synechococcus elongatus PCC 7942 = FACHB-805]Q5N0E4.1 RecName: Full=Glycerol-3-phosphate acyltransferase; AltName: Full=Acyl-PO4 G3P acyltran